ncbi:hypothetical protein PQU92_06035 [Asticcacaulis sp. BYS171W]|uniref:Uncharacterized protein n=1 Tax=Asticcacaulis aquaticus TaxID=2984212 RepID=A0ABT5HRX9_9CAUL|nr:hypothetical protein [Asticcacaulis aquaticus]MDC7682826.1 hypothetical protein [Asticcacaulis aquaticus]
MRNHDRTLFRVKLGFLAVFILISAGILIYGVFYEMPRRKCEAAGGWWTDKYRSCETPIYLPLLTGRKAGEPRKIIWPDAQKAGQASNGAPRPEEKPASASASSSVAASQ